MARLSSSFCVAGSHSRDLHGHTAAASLDPLRRNGNHRRSPGR